MTERLAKKKKKLYETNTEIQVNIETEAIIIIIIIEEENRIVVMENRAEMEVKYPSVYLFLTSIHKPYHIHYKNTLTVLDLLKRSF